MKGELSSLMALTSSGKSGSFFYYSVDAKYVLKTIRRDEFKSFKTMLKNYHNHIKKNKNSLIPKFFGLHKIQYTTKKAIRGKINQKKVYFIIMNNIFNSQLEIHKRYDLKGSTHKRYITSSDPSLARKDLDFLRLEKFIELDINDVKELKEIIKNDCEFFDKNKIIDYSLLIGYHMKDNHHDIEILDEVKDKGHIYLSHDENVIFFIGIIDILTTFNFFKKGEFITRRTFCGKGISCIPPPKYAKRFYEFMDGIVKNPIN